MKTSLFFLLMLVAPASLFAADYYWVGNAGNWSDLNHWATSSGGSEFHSTLPGAADNVIFDANSFSSIGQQVTLDMDPIEIASLNANEATNQPLLFGVNFGDEFIVHDNFYLPATVNREMKSIKLRGGAGEHEILTGGVNLGGSSFVTIESQGTWNMLDELESAYIYVIDGNFRTNDIECTARVNLEVFENGTGYVDLGTSLLNTRILEVFDENDISAENATISMINPGFLANQGIFQGAGLSYGELICLHDIKIYDNNTFNALTFLPGTTITLEASTTQVSGTIDAIGTSDASISIISSLAGSQASLSVSTGTVDGEYLVLQDNNATGGAVFTANFSIDNGNNTGWNIIENQPDDYFWVGGSGLWTDLSHWATTSGGTEFHTEAPGQLDDIYIDENSFVEAGELELNTDIHINNFHVSNVPVGTDISHPTSAYNFFVHGSFDLSPDMNIYLATVRLVGDGEQHFNSGGNFLGDGCKIILESTGTYLLNGDLHTDRIELLTGTFDANEYSVEVSEIIETGGSDIYAADFSNCTILTSGWRWYNTNGFVDLSGSTLTVTGDMITGSLNFDSIIFGTVGMVDINQDLNAQTLVFPEGSEVQFEAQSTVNWTEMMMNGTEENPVSIHSSEPGNEFFFESSSGQVDATYLNIIDNHAGGGAVYNAEFSNLGSNVLGWNDISSVLEYEKEFSFYPNPATDNLFISCSSNARLVVYSMEGRIVQTLMSGSNSLINMSSGLYIIQDLNSGRRSKLLINQ